MNIIVSAKHKCCTTDYRTLSSGERQKVEMAIFFENPFILNIIIVVRIKITFIECVLASFNF